MKVHGILALAFASAITAYAVGQPPERKDEISLHLAVEEFNQREAKNYLDASQKPLTENELIAAIRRMPDIARAQTGQPGFDAMLKIAETEILPRNAYLTTLRGVYTETHYCEVFDIQLTLVTGKESHLTVPIRQITLSSRKIRPEERRKLDAKFAALKTKAATE